MARPKHNKAVKATSKYSDKERIEWCIKQIDLLKKNHMTINRNFDDIYKALKHHEDNFAKVQSTVNKIGKILEDKDKNRIIIP